MLLPSTAEDYLSEQLEKAEPILTLRNIAIAGILLLVADALSLFIVQNLNPAEFPPGVAYEDLIVQFVDYALFFYVSAYLLYLVAKVLGGKGKFQEQMHLQSVVAIAIALIQALLIVLSSFYIPEDLMLLTLFSLPLLFAGLYSIYMDYKIIKVAHKHDKKKAALSIVGFWIVLIAVIFILYAGVYLLTGQS